MGTLTIMWRRAVTYWRNHLLLRDSFLALVCAFCAYTRVDHSLIDGFLFPYNNRIAQFFNILLSLPLFIRRSNPELAANLFLTFCLAQLLLGPSLLPSDSFGLIMVYTVLVYADRSHTKKYLLLAFAITNLAALFFACASTYGFLLPVPTHSHGVRPCLNDIDEIAHESCGTQFFNNLLSFSITIDIVLALIIFGAFWNRSRKQLAQSIRKRNAAISFRQQEEARLAASAERARIARDMHDVVAHTLSIVIVQADAGRYAGIQNSNVALKIMQTIKHESQKVLDDMHHLFGSFTDPDHENVDFDSAQGNHVTVSASHDRKRVMPFKKTRRVTDLNTVNNYQSIDHLIEQAQNASPTLVIERKTWGTPRPNELSQQANIVVYRCTQEALSNIRKHAAPSSHVVIQEDWSANSLHLTISDDNGGGSNEPQEITVEPGYGLIGLQERFDSIGGQFEAKSIDTGGFCIDATLPFYCDDSSAAQQDNSAYSDLKTLNTNRNLNTYQLRTEEQSFLKLNIVEQLSQWVSHHYLVSDTLFALIMTLLLSMSEINMISLNPSALQKNDVASLTLISQFLCICIPLIFRRKFPDLSAAFIAITATVEIVTSPWISAVNCLVVISIYSAVTYGNRATRIWVPIAIISNLVLIGVRFATEFTSGYPTPAAWLFRNYTSLLHVEPVIVESTAQQVAWGNILAVSITCTCSLLLGLWRRTSDSNLILLHEQEEALRVGQRQHRQLAANAERARIGTEIQNEVTEAINRVLERADDGIQIIHKFQANHQPIPSETIESSFELIGREGRLALARMRELLGILRKTGSSDDASTNSKAQSTMQLEPIQQIKR